MFRIASASFSRRSLPKGKCSFRRFLSATPLSSKRLQISPHVQAALEKGVPVVALESTIVAHGMPYPQNYQVAQEVENILRSKNVVPATIAVKDGVGRIGLSDDELHELALAGSDALKVSTRELSLLMGSHTSQKWGATTVASTMTLAHLAGISTFVTGGIGGVHRNGEISMDVSADLTELSRTPVIVVSAGIKSILDIDRTLEVLESLAVPTVTYKSDEFPAFFSPTSGCKTPWRVDSAEAIADAYLAARSLRLNHGMLVAVPNSDPAGESVEQAIHDALKEASAKGIIGQALTPFVLKTVAEQTDGDSLLSNIALVKNNAEIGADIAIAIACAKFESSTSSFLEFMDEEHFDSSSSKVVVLGGAVVDIVSKSTANLISGTSNPGSCVEADGGVGRNIAEVLAQLRCRPLLYTAVGNDERGKGLMQRFEKVGGIDHSHVVPSGFGTATYLSVLDEKGDLHTAVASMDIFSSVPVPSKNSLRGAKYLVMDANPPVAVLEEAAEIASELTVQVCFEPTSVPKARLVSGRLKLLRHVSYAFPNLDELMAMADCITDIPNHQLTGEKHPFNSNEEAAATILLKHMHPTFACLVVTMGHKGVLLATREDEELSYLTIPVRVEIGIMRNSTGAGDSLCGAFIAAKLSGKSDYEAVLFGMQAAKESLLTADRAISPDLSKLRENLR